MKQDIGGKRPWTLRRPSTMTPVEAHGSHYQQDDLRHLLATAGAMSWGITEVRALSSQRRTA